jgi:hypothetical protein
MVLTGENRSRATGWAIVPLDVYHIKNFSSYRTVNIFHLCYRL